MIVFTWFQACFRTSAFAPAGGDLSKFSEAVMLNPVDNCGRTPYAVAVSGAAVGVAGCAEVARLLAGAIAARDAEAASKTIGAQTCEDEATDDDYCYFDESSEDA